MKNVTLTLLSLLLLTVFILPSAKGLKCYNYVEDGKTISGDNEDTQDCTAPQGSHPVCLKKTIGQVITRSCGERKGRELTCQTTDKITECACNKDGCNKDIVGSGETSSKKSGAFYLGGTLTHLLLISIPAFFLH